MVCRSFNLAPCVNIHDFRAVAELEIYPSSNHSRMVFNWRVDSEHYIVQPNNTENIKSKLTDTFFLQMAEASPIPSPLFFRLHCVLQS